MVCASNRVSAALPLLACADLKTPVLQAVADERALQLIVINYQDCERHLVRKGLQPSSNGAGVDRIITRHSAFLLQPAARQFLTDLGLIRETGRMGSVCEWQRSR